MNMQPTIRDIEQAHLLAAGLVLKDPAFGPVFARLEEELQSAKDMDAESDPVKRARALLAANEGAGA